VLVCKQSETVLPKANFGPEINVCDFTRGSISRDIVKDRHFCVVKDPHFRVVKDRHLCVVKERQLGVVKNRHLYVVKDRHL